MEEVQKQVNTYSFAEFRNDITGFESICVRESHYDPILKSFELKGDFGISHEVYTFRLEGISRLIFERYENAVSLTDSGIELQDIGVFLKLQDGSAPHVVFSLNGGRYFIWCSRVIINENEYLIKNIRFWDEDLKRLGFNSDWSPETSY